jgi:uncharacterized protein (TIGR02466 family)
MKTRLDSLFATPVWRTRLTGFERENARMLRDLEALYRMDPDGLERSNVLGWHSQDDLHRRPAFARLARTVLGLIETEVTPALNLDSSENRFVIDSMWAVRNEKFAYHFVHRHPSCFFSGVYYLQAPDPTGALNFHDPRADVRMLRPPMLDESAFTQQIVSYRPQIRALIIFPAWLPHDVSPNRSNSPRVAVSFDIITVPRARRSQKNAGHRHA